MTAELSVQGKLFMEGSKSVLSVPYTESTPWECGLLGGNLAASGDQMKICVTRDAFTP